MATDQLMAPLPKLILGPGCSIIMEALDPTTGAPIAGVTVSGLSIYGDDVGPSDTLELVAGPFMLVPGEDA